jgi:hypothetical protein
MILNSWKDAEVLVTHQFLSVKTEAARRQALIVLALRDKANAIHAEMKRGNA